MTFAFISSIRKTLANPDIAIDLGTANTRLYAQGQGLIADEPSLVRMRAETGDIEAVGARAVEPALYASEQRLVSPLRAGVIADVDAAAALLTPLVKRARTRGLIKPRVLACAPTDAQGDERAALVEAMHRAGASAVKVVPEPLAAAIGIGIDVSSGYAQMIVDIGDGVTDIAIIRSGSLIFTAAVRTACSDLIAAVSNLVADRYGIDIYRQDAERLMRLVGARNKYSPTVPYVVAGSDSRTGLQRRVPIAAQEVAEVFDPVLKKITSFVGKTFRKLPDEIACEVIENGIQLTGGGVCLWGMGKLIADETAITVRSAKDPLRSVINGARKMLAVGVQTNLWLDQ